MPWRTPPSVRSTDLLGIQRKYFDLHPDGLLKTSGFDIYLHHKPHYLSAELIKKGVWEPHTTGLVTGLLSGRKSVVVDVGANIGWFTLLAASLGGRVWAFEPEPENLSLVRRSVLQNGFEEVRAEQIAITNYDGTAKLSLSDSSAGFHSIVRHVGEKRIEVPCMKIDTLFPIGNIDLLKVDVEGAEPQVLEGASNAIETGRVKNIIMEYRPESWASRENVLNQFQISQVDGTSSFKPKNCPIEDNLLLNLLGG
jgi:FkbM family methyltransferase